MFHLSEFIFLGGFIVFIAAILVLDMLVIDKKAHEVSIREAGTWTAVWITLALAFGFPLVQGRHGARHKQLCRP